jgi:hypothetical protein
LAEAAGRIVALSRTTAPALPFNTAGIYGRYVAAKGKIHTAIWKERYQEW